MSSNGRSEQAIIQRHIPQGYQFGVSELDLKAEDFKNQTINWKTFLDGNIIDTQEYDFITHYEATPAESRGQLLLSRSPWSGEQFHHLIESLTSEQALSHTLSLVDEAFKRVPATTALFNPFFSSPSAASDSTNAFFSLLSRGNAFQSNMAASIISRVASLQDLTLTADEQRLLLNFIFEQLRLENNEFVDTSGRNLQILMKKPIYQSRFVKMNGLGLISSLLNKECKFQLQYQLVFCLWLLSYKPEYVEAMSDYNIVPTLIRVLEQSVKEKVSRISIATLRNSLEKPKDEELVRQNALHMLRTHLSKQLDITESRRFEDPDIDADILYIREKLSLYADAFSNLDEYLLEVQSGLLQWGVIHDSETFWSENAIKLNKHNYAALKQLIQLLESEDPLVQTIACHDLAKYLKHNPKGKWIVENLGGKHKIATILLQTQDEDLRYKGLLCLQQLVFTNLKSMDLMIGKIQDSLKKQDS